jgi:hypothetical protein
MPRGVEPKKRTLSPKLQLKRLGVMIPTEVFEWLKVKSERERKSLSLLLTEILMQVKEEDSKKKTKKI